MNLRFICAFLSLSLVLFSTAEAKAQSFEKIAGLDVAIWSPSAMTSEKFPLVMFSHGYRGRNTQSKFIMEALARAGYLVIAPNHKDAIGQGHAQATRLKFGPKADWSDETVAYRRSEIIRLIEALHKDVTWNSRVDWSKFALAGHSLGGYSVLALAGALPSWKIPNVKAVLALSPYCIPLLLHGSIKQLAVPVMYQTGTRDVGIAPSVMRSGGAFDLTPSPAELIVFDKAGHFAWTNFERKRSMQDSIDYYCVSFLNKYLKNDPAADPSVQQPEVVQLKTK